MADEEPAWDGQGEDPWVPQRLDRLLGLSDAERQVRRVMWGLLSKWIVGVSRAVLRGVRPDPSAVFSRDRAWQEAVREFEQEALLPLIRSAYTPLLGEGFPFEARPFVTKHLAEVSNRLVRTPDEVFDLVSGEVAQGVNLGESIDDLRTRIDDVLSTTATPRWENRATVIARTETIGAMNGARDDSFKAVIEETGEEFEKLWLSTDDARTRPEHVRADLQRVPVNQPFMVGGEPLAFPGDPAGSAENTIQCRCTQLLVRPGESIDLSNRQFGG